jgi:hypothetical protein
MEIGVGVPDFPNVENDDAIDKAEMREVPDVPTFLGKAELKNFQANFAERDLSSAGHKFS